MNISIQDEQNFTGLDFLCHQCQAKFTTIQKHTPKWIYRIYLKSKMQIACITLISKSTIFHSSNVFWSTKMFNVSSA